MPLETGMVERATEGAVVVAGGVVGVVEEGIRTMTGATNEIMVEIENLAVGVMRTVIAAGAVVTMTDMMIEEGTADLDMVVVKHRLPSYRPL